MSTTICRLTVFFEAPFWKGVFEITENGKLSAAEITFGAQPKDCEVLSFILKLFYSLKFSPAVSAAVKEDSRNPKRIQRDIKKQLLPSGTGTKSQQALKLQYEQSKQMRKAKSKAQKNEKAARIFALKQQKKR